MSAKVLPDFLKTSSRVGDQVLMSFSGLRKSAPACRWALRNVRVLAICFRTLALLTLCFIRLWVFGELQFAALAVDVFNGVCGALFEV